MCMIIHVTHTQTNKHASKRSYRQIDTQKKQKHTHIQTNRQTYNIHTSRTNKKSERTDKKTDTEMDIDTDIRRRRASYSSSACCLAICSWPHIVATPSTLSVSAGVASTWAKCPRTSSSWSKMVGVGSWDWPPSSSKAWLLLGIAWCSAGSCCKDVTPGIRSYGRCHSPTSEVLINSPHMT